MFSFAKIHGLFLHGTPKGMTIGTSEVISGESYSMNEIILAVISDYIKTNAQPIKSIKNLSQKRRTNNTFRK